MTFNPLLPFAVLVPLTLVIVLACGVVAMTRSGRRIMWILRALTVVVMATALARPGIPSEVAVTKEEATAQVYLVVDITASMVAEDWNGNEPRLEGLKADIEDLIDAMPSAKFSLLVFDSTSTMRVPLTTDDAALRSAVSILEPEPTLSSSGTSPMEPAQLLSNRLAKGAEAHPGEDQYVFYFGDGEATAENAPKTFDGEYALAGGAVFGYGTEQGGKMKETLDHFSERTPKYITDRTTNQPALSKIDENNLKTIASALNVEYVHRSAATSITQDYKVPQLESKLINTDEQRGVDELFWIPLIAVFAWLIVEITLSVKRVREIARIGKS